MIRPPAGVKLFQGGVHLLAALVKLPVSWLKNLDLVRFGGLNEHENYIAALADPLIERGG